MSIPDDDGFDITTNDAVGVVRLSRPARRNALTVSQFAHLGARLGELEDGSIKALVLAGSQGAFCAGADLANVTSDATPAERLRGTRAVGRTISQLYNLPIPTLAFVDGPAVGAGLGLALACDLVLATRRARFGVPYARYGLTMDAGTSWLLSRTVGPHWAKRLGLLGELIDAPEAERLGLVTDLVDEADGDATAAALARRLAEVPPLSAAATKRLVDLCSTASLDHAIATEPWFQAVCAGDRSEATNSTSTIRET